MKTKTTLGLLAFAAMAATLAPAIVHAAVTGDLSVLFSFDLAALGATGVLFADAVGMPLADQIKQYEAKRALAKTSAEGVMKKALDEARSLEEAEEEAYNGFVADIEQIDKHLTLLARHEKLMAGKAVVIDSSTGKGAEGGSAVELRGAGAGSGVLSVRPNVEKGVAFVRFSLAMIRAKGNVMQARQIAEHTEGWKDTTPQVLNCLQYAAERGDTKSLLVSKAAVAAATTTSSTWAGPLVQYQDMASEFIELLRPLTIIGKLTGVRRVPFNIRIARQTAGVSGAFVGEGAPKPVNAMAFDNITMQWYKAAVIVVLTDEVMRFSSPAIEALARQDMLDGLSQFLDMRLLDPAYPGVANVSPASLTYGVTPRASSGVTIAAITADAKFMIASFLTANTRVSAGVWIMSPLTALGLSMLRDANDEFVFPTIGINGGTWFGMPVITSTAVAPSGSPTDRHVILMDQSEILLADDGEIAIDMSMEASLQMSDTPSAGAQSLVSLWQNNMVGLRAERYINWAKRRDTAVAILDNLSV